MDVINRKCVIGLIGFDFDNDKILGDYKTERHGHWRMGTMICSNILINSTNEEWKNDIPSSSMMNIWISHHHIFPYDLWIVPSHCSGKMYPSGWGSCWSSRGHWKGMIAEVISRVVSIVVQWCFNLIHVRSWAAGFTFYFISMCWSDFPVFPTVSGLRNQSV